MATWLPTGETLLHRQMVRDMIDWFSRQGWTVLYAATDGYPDPPAQGRHEPDVIAEDAYGTWIIGEVKTGEGDLNTEHSRQQYADFAGRFMKGTGIQCLVYIGVPRQYESDLRTVLANVGVAWSSNVHILPYG